MTENSKMEITFGDAIRAARLSLGVSQEELADRVGMKRPYLSNIENNERPRNPKPATKKKLANGLGISVEEVMRIGRDYIESSPLIVQAITERGTAIMGSEHMDARLRLKRLIDVVEWTPQRENDVSERLWLFAREDAERRSR